MTANVWSTENDGKDLHSITYKSLTQCHHLPLQFDDGFLEAKGLNMDHLQQQKRRKMQKSFFIKSFLIINLATISFLQSRMIHMAEDL